MTTPTGANTACGFSARHRQRVALAPIQNPQEIRIDPFDRKSNRTGYIIIDPRTGRLDQFDRNSNRLGYRTTTSPNLPSDGRAYDQNGRSISIDRRAR